MKRGIAYLALAILASTITWVARSQGVEPHAPGPHYFGPLNSPYKRAQQSVTFVFKKGTTGRIFPIGTAFFVQVVNFPPIERLAKGEPKKSLYLATAKHVLLQGRSFLDTIYLKLKRNRKDLAQVVPIPLTSERRVLWLHPNDETADVAVISIRGDLLDGTDYNALTAVEHKRSESIWGDEEVPDKSLFQNLEFTEGTEVFFAGLFQGYYGEIENEPIVRFGRIALMPKQKIPWRESLTQQFVYTDLFLVECAAYAGNSGAPLFVYSIRSKTSEFEDDWVLGGILKGVYNDRSKLEYTEAKQDTFIRQSMGITTVVPSYKLHEILMSDSVRAARRPRKK